MILMLKGHSCNGCCSMLKRVCLALRDMSLRGCGRQAAELTLCSEGLSPCRAKGCAALPSKGNDMYAFTWCCTSSD